MALPLLDFASYIVRDLAVRTKAKRGGNVVFSSNHSSPQYILPARAQNETEQEFAARLKQFRTRIPRGSDQKLRLALAMEACTRAGMGLFAAASYTLEALRRAEEISGARQLEFEKLGVLSYKRIEPRIGATQRGRRKKRKKRGYHPEYRQIETIRTEVSRFRRTFDGFEKKFESEFGLYRFQYHRDAEWFAEVEPFQRQLISRCERELGPTHELTASHALTMARMLHEQGKFEDAEIEYRSALDRWRSVSGAPPGDPEFVINSILEDVTKCKNRQTRVLLPRPKVVQ
jgi:hypothetical protein